MRLKKTRAKEKGQKPVSGAPKRRGTKEGGLTSGEGGLASGRCGLEIRRDKAWLVSSRTSKAKGAQKRTDAERKGGARGGG